MADDNKDVQTALEFHLEMAAEMASQLPASREMSMVKTKIDEAGLWLGIAPTTNVEKLPPHLGVEQK